MPKIAPLFDFKTRFFNTKNGGLRRDQWFTAEFAASGLSGLSEL